MSQASNQKLQFSIDETVWLRNGYEAEEILSLALDPDITIEETTQYIAIKGALRLSGEYKPAESDDAAERTDEGSYRLVDEITETVDGTALMEHYFPVDITIPASRVRSIEDVYVTVDALDYIQPNKGCIQLQADISILGLINEEPKPARQEKVPFTEEEDDYNPYETVSYESYREPEPEEEQESPAANYDYSEQEEGIPFAFEEAEEEEVEFVSTIRSELPTSEETETPVSSLDTDEEVEENGSTGRSEILDNVVAETPVEPNLEHPFKQFKPETTEVNIGAKKETPAEPVAVPSPVVVQQIPAEQAPIVQQSMEPTPAIVEAPTVEEPQEKKKKYRDENALYLTKMLTQENERFTRVKICIVQQGDNLETIAERYKVPVTNILRRNQLSSDRLNEGQVLYIPVKG